MPRFGICTNIENAPAVKAAGWDYVEESVQVILEGTLDDAQWTKLDNVKSASLKIPAANCLVPGPMKMVGPTADFDALRSYMTKVTDRAAKVGIKTLVFGSGVARHVPEGFDRDVAVGQITEFARMSAELAEQQSITIVVEPLNKGECNIINSVAEAMTYVKAMNHPNFQCLVDSYHFWLEDEPLENLVHAMPWIKHVHLADKDGRVAPGLSGNSDYCPFFKVLKDGDYDGLISFEGAAMAAFELTAPKVLAFIKDQWEQS